jgi:hypothetical protein
MHENKGHGAVGYRFSTRIRKYAAKAKLGWNPDPSSSIVANNHTTHFTPVLTV